MQKENEGVPERAKEQALVGLSRDPNKLLSFSISSLLYPPIAEFSSVLGYSAMCAWGLCCPPWFPHSRLGGLPFSFQDFSFVYLGFL